MVALYDPKLLELPDLEQVTIPEIKTAAKEYLALEADLKAALTHLAELEEARAGAVAADRQAGASWLRAGRKGAEPGSPQTAKADTAIAKARERNARLRVAATDSRQALGDVIEAHREAWSEAAEARARAARAAIAKHLDDLAAAHGDLQAALALRDWIAAESGSQRPRWLPGRHASKIAALSGPAGEPTPVDAVLAGLRELTERPAVRVRPVPVRPLAPQPGVPVMDSAA